MILGRSHTFHGGMIPHKILIFWENDIPAWSEYGAERQLPHTPESPEFRYIMTDMLLRFALEYSHARNKLQALKRRLEELYGASFEQFMQRLDINSQNERCMKVLNEMRKTMEAAKLGIEATIICYRGSPIRKIKANLERLNMSYRLVIV